MGCHDCKPLPPLSTNDIARYWSHVEILGSDECWPWHGAMSYGYGALGVKSSRLKSGREVVRATRIAMLLATGEDPYPLLACHSCDARYAKTDKSYRRCCNPNHLFKGTQAENLADMAQKGRSPSGDQHHSIRNPHSMPSGDRHWSRRWIAEGKAIRKKNRHGNQT